MPKLNLLSEKIGERRSVRNRVFKILTLYPETRESDKRLIWQYLLSFGFIDSTEYTDFDGYIKYENFLKAPSFETITRAKRKVVEEHPELDSSPAVKQAKIEKEKTKGNFIDWFLGR